MNDCYSPDTGEHINTDTPADWMGRAGMPAPVYDIKTHGCFFRDGAWQLIEWPKPSIADLQAGLVKSVNAIYQQKMGAIASQYPSYERESWTIQIQEAQLLQTGVSGPTPWLNACAAERGMDRFDLADRVLAKDAAYREISGHLSGIRQRHEDAIAKLETVEHAKGYDVHAWWPIEEGEPQQ